ncbi:hypothetical protein ABPG75_000934 [Micractinium tetrahymenae]
MNDTTRLDAITGRLRALVQHWHALQQQIEQLEHPGAPPPPQQEARLEWPGAVPPPPRAQLLELLRAELACIACSVQAHFVAAVEEAALLMGMALTAPPSGERFASLPRRTSGASSLC